MPVLIIMSRKLPKSPFHIILNRNLIAYLMMYPYVSHVYLTCIRLSLVTSCASASCAARRGSYAAGERGESGYISYSCIVFGYISYQIRILMYLDVSCVYPVKYMYLGRFLGVTLACTLDTYRDLRQDTCILDSSSRYNKIHRDTKSRYMRDTYGIHSEIHTF